MNPGSVYFNFEYQSIEAKGYLKPIEAALEGGDYDIIGVSAGFDACVRIGAWLLETKDLEIIDRMIAQGSLKG